MVSFSDPSIDSPQKTDMTMENTPFEDVSPIKHGDVPLSCLFSGGIYPYLLYLHNGGPHIYGWVTLLNLRLDRPEAELDSPRSCIFVNHLSWWLLC